MKIEEAEIPFLIRNGKEKEVISFLYKKVFPSVKKYITANRGKREDALDVFQDAMMVFYSNVTANKYNEEVYKVYGYIYRLSINRWLNKIRKDKRMIFTGEIVEFGLEDVWIDSMVMPEEENCIRKFFSGIGAKCVELLTLTVFYNMLLEDVLLRMQFSSLSAVKMQQQRCKQKLMEEIRNNPSLLQKIKGI